MPSILRGNPDKIPIRELKRQRRAETNGRLRERLSCIIASIENPRAAKEIAEQVDYSEQTIRTWIKDYNRHGIEGLKLKSAGGRPRKLNQEQEAWIFRVIERSPESYGFFTAIWDCKLLAQACLESWDLEVSHETIRRILKQGGYSFKQPEYQHPKGNPEQKKRQSKRFRSWQNN